MKNNQLVKVLGVSLLSVVALAAVSQEASAAPVSTTTEGRVEFVEPTPPGNEDGPFALIKPGTYEEWITIPKGEGKQTLDGKFRFSFVPNFDFGKVEVSSTDSYSNLKHTIPYQAYDLKDPKMFNENDGRTVKHLPPFIQVENLQGTNAPFKVSVQATTFKGATKGHELPNTRIQIKAFEAKNNVFNKGNENASAKDILDGPAGLATDAYLDLNATDVVIMQTAQGKGKETDGSASSLVFNKGYSLTEDYTTAKIADDDSVRLFVPAQDAPTIGEKYVSNVTWNLENTM